MLRAALCPSPTCAVVSMTVLLLSPAVLAQNAPDLPRPSPLARVEQRVGITDFAVEYSSPGMKKRKIWGGLVPYDGLWRTGANAATKLEASNDFTFGGTVVPAGTYSLFTIPGKKSWTVILNSDSSASTRDYDETNDVARVTVRAAAAPLRERMAFLFSNTTDDTTRLDLEWEKLRVSVPLQVDTRAHVMKNIEETLDSAWRPHFASARWLLENNGDLVEAIGYVNTSIEIKPTWWNNWVKAQILAKQGNRSEAVAAAEKAKSLGAGDAIFEGFFQENVDKAIADWQKS